MKKTKKLFCLFTTAILAVSAFATTMTASAYYDASAYYKENRYYESEPKIKVGDFSYKFKKNIKYGSTEINYSATVVEIPNMQKVELPEKVTYDGIEFTVTDLDLYGDYTKANNSPNIIENKYYNVEEIMLPETIYNITELRGFPKLKKLNIPRNTIIGRISSDRLFYDDVVPDSIQYYEYEEDKYYYNTFFVNCPLLKPSLDENNPYYIYKNDLLLTKDGKNLLMSFTTASTIEIPDGVQRIYNLGGNGFELSKNVKLPDTLKYIEDSAFYKSMITKAELPDGLIQIGWKAFYGSDVKTINFNDNLIHVNPESFRGCKNLKKITLPENVRFIHYSSFRGCTNLKNVKITAKGTYIDDWAFLKCTKLKNVTINGVKTIGVKTFYKCKNLSKVTINNPKKAPGICKKAFKYTKNGIKFYVKNMKVAKSLKKNLKGSGVKNAKIYVGKTLVYKNVK